MAEVQAQDAGRGPGPVRIAVWMGACALLLAPLVAMQFTKEVAWTASDFLVFGAMLFGSLGLYELATHRAGSRTYRWAAGVTVASGFLLVWINLAVGAIGDEDNPANLMLMGVLVIPFLGAVGTRLRAAGMAYVLLATAFAQLTVGIVALTRNLGADAPGWPGDAIGVTGLFACLWLAAAFLFRRAARQEMAA